MPYTHYHWYLLCFIVLSTMSYVILFLVQLNRMLATAILRTGLHHTDCVPLHTEWATYQDTCWISLDSCLSTCAGSLFIVKLSIDNKSCVVKYPPASSIYCTAEVSGSWTQEGGQRTFEEPAWWHWSLIFKQTAKLISLYCSFKFFIVNFMYFVNLF